MVAFNMPSWISKKISNFQGKAEAFFAGREAGKFGQVENPAWANKTNGFCHFTDSPQKEKKPLLYLPTTSFGPLRFVLHKNILSGVAGPVHRIVALNRNGKINGELVFTHSPSAVSIDSLNTKKHDAGLGRSLVLLLSKEIPSNKTITVHATHYSAPFYKGLDFHEFGDQPDGSFFLACKRDNLIKNKGAVSKTGARKGKVFVR